MLSRILFILRYYLHLVVLFVLQKPLFMLFTGEGKDLSAIDYWRVAKAGFSMDLCTAAYLTAIPLLVAIVSVWWKSSSPFNPKKILRPYHIVVAIALALIFVADISLYPFWQFKLDASVFIYLSNPSDATASVSTGYLIVRILAVMVCAIIIYIILNRSTPSTFNPERKRERAKPLTSLILLAMGGVLFLALRGGVKESVMNVGRVYFCNNQYLNHSAVNPAFSLFSSIGKSKDFSKQYRFMDEEMARSVFSDLYCQGRDTLLTQRLLNTQRPNVLIIEMESFGTTYTDPQDENYSSLSVTPNYWKIAEEGIVFNNLYCNSYRTDRGTVSIFSGYPAFPKASLMKQPKIVEKLPRLAEAFAKEGYSTYFLYGGDINFTNTKGYLTTNGFRSLVSDTDFTSQEQHTNKWGVDDAITFRYLSNQLESLKSPFFYGFLTLSSHEPFDVPEKILQDKVYNSAAYTDRCLGEFIGRLKESPVWDSLLIVILPDHNMLYNRQYDPDYFRCRMIWTGGAIAEHGIQINTKMNQSDVASTLLSQMGMNIESFPLSRNILSPNYTNQSAFCCYNNGFIVVDSLGSIAYDLDMNNLTSGQKDKEQTGKALLQSLYGILDRISKSE